jgi:hypothetical protein
MHGPIPCVLNVVGACAPRSLSISDGQIFRVRRVGPREARGVAATEEAEAKVPAKGPGKAQARDTSITLAEFGLYAFGQFRQLNNHAFVCADSNLLVPVGSANGKLNAPPIDAGDCRLPDDDPTGRRRCQVAHVNARAERA